MHHQCSPSKFFALAFCALLLTAAEAQAHGPTIRLSHAGLRPKSLVIEVGSTVHFHNDSSSDLPCTVRALDDSFQSPPLARAEGWHYTFDTPGVFEIRLSESSRATAKITVYSPR